MLNTNLNFERQNNYGGRNERGNLRNNDTRNNNNTRMIKNGDIFYVELDGVGCEQQGLRPVIIIQNDVGNRHSPTVIVAAITSQISKAKLPTHVAIKANEQNGLDRDSVVLLEQVRTLDKKRLGDLIGFVSEEEMNSIDNALDVSIHNKRQNNKNYSNDKQDEIFNISVIREYVEALKELDDLIVNSFVKSTSIKRSKNTILKQLHEYCSKFNKNASLFYKDIIINNNHNYRERNVINA